MAHVHFPSNKRSADILRQFGEAPQNVHTVGSTALDGIAHIAELPREDVFAKIGIEPRSWNILVTHHPVTLQADGGLAEINELLTALDEVAQDAAIIITGSNADTGHRAVRDKIERFVAQHDNVVFRESLGQFLYFNTLRRQPAAVY